MADEHPMLIDGEWRFSMERLTELKTVVVNLG